MERQNHDGIDLTSFEQPDGGAVPVAREDGAAEATDNTKPWLRVFGSFMIFVNIWGLVFIFGVFQSFYELSYISNQSASTISWIGTIQSAMLSILGVFTGPLYDRGKFRIMSLIGSALILFGLAMMSCSTEYWQLFLSQGLCIGIGGGLLYVPSLVLVSRSFNEKRAMATSILTCGIGIGGVLYVAVLQSLLPRLGFAWTIRVILLIETSIFATALTAFMYNAPAEGGSLPSASLVDIAALKDGAFLAYSTAAFLTFLGYLVPFFYIPLFAQVNLGASANFSFWLLALSSASSIVGRLGSAFLAQRFGIMFSWMACSAASAVLCFTWIVVHNVPTFATFCALYGCFSGALVALPPAMFPRLCRDTNKIGTWMGMSWFASGISFLVGAPIAGALTKIGVSEGQHVNFVPAQIWSGCLLASGTTLVGLLWKILYNRTTSRDIFF